MQTPCTVGFSTQDKSMSRSETAAAVVANNLHTRSDRKMKSKTVKVYETRSVLTDSESVANNYQLVNSNIPVKIISPILLTNIVVPKFAHTIVLSNSVYNKVLHFDKK